MFLSKTLGKVKFLNFITFARRSCFHFCFSVCLPACLVVCFFVCPSVSTLSQKRVNKFSLKFVEGIVMCKENIRARLQETLRQARVYGLTPKLYELFTNFKLYCLSSISNNLVQFLLQILKNY